MVPLRAWNNYCTIFFTIDTTEHLQIDQPCGIGSKTTSHEDLMLIVVEIGTRKPVNGRE